MFCYQCEQTYRSDEGAGCAGSKGMCGKDAATSDLQDVLLHVCEGIGQYLYRARAIGATDVEADRFVLYAFFTTLTNVNFNASKFVQLIAQAGEIKSRVKSLYEAAAAKAGKTPETLSGAAAFVPAADMNGLLAQASEAAVRKDAATLEEDVVGLRSLVLYGLKGVCAYAHHAQVLGEERDAIYEAVEHALDLLASEPKEIGPLLDEALALGHANFVAMEALDAANTGNFGTPEPTQVRMTPMKGKAMLVSGHDLKDLLRHPGSDEGQGDQRLHAWRNVAGAFLSQAQDLSASRRQLRRRLAGSAEGIRRIPWPDRHDVELSDRAAAALPRPHLHGRAGRLAGHPPHRRTAISPSWRKPPPRCRVLLRTRRRRRSPSALVAMPCSASPTR